MLGAKVFFLVTGFVQQPLLRFAVGLNDFGGLAQALVVSNTVNNVVVSSGTQGVSRVVAGAPGHEDEALRAALRVHVPLALVVAAAMAAAMGEAVRVADDKSVQAQAEAEAEEDEAARGMRAAPRAKRA